MELAKSGKQQPPMIIVMKGPSKSREKRQIAINLAEFLHYPLIDEDDFVSFDESSFKTIIQITKTQLQLKLQIVISTTLSQTTYIDQLSELAMSEEARLVMIECENDRVRGDFHKFGFVLVFNIDITKPFKVEEFAPKILDVLKDNYQKVSREDTHRSISTTNRPRIFKDAHLHEFFFTETKDPKMKMGSSSKLQYCNFCEEVVSGPTYQCIQCDEFILHESCAEYYANFELILEEGPLFYTQQDPNPYQYEFTQMNKCRRCESYSLDCNNCLLQAHIKCGVLPTIWRYKKHEHPLNFVIMPYWFKYEYQCIACSKFGTYIGYKCYGCKIDLHIICALRMSCRNKPCIVTGPWGGMHGNEWDDKSHSAVRRLSIIYGTYTCIDSIQIEYVDDETTTWLEKHGGNHNQADLKKVEVILDYPREYLAEVQGTCGRLYHMECLIRSLTFRTNKNTYGPYGPFTPKDDKSFSSLHGTDGGKYKVVGFHGKGGWHLDSIGFHLEPISQLKRRPKINTIGDNKTSTSTG